jgi:hypothetical protein
MDYRQEPGLCLGFDPLKQSFRRELLENVWDASNLLQPGFAALRPASL